MTSYTVVWRFDLDARSAYDAAEFAQRILKSEPCDWVYEVINNDTGEISTVDLEISEDYHDGEI